jgi:dethiobiotin synthetase
MAAVFVAGTGTDIGKTYVTAALLRAMAGAGRPAMALKPVASGFDEAAPAGSDPAVLLEAMGRPVTAAAIAAITPWRYRAPLAPDQAARREGRVVDGAAVIAFCQAEIAAAGKALVFVESAGGIMSPLDDMRTMLDLASALAAPVLLVTGAYLGAISHTLTAVEVIRAAGLAIRAVVVNGAAGPLELDEATAAIQARLPGVAVTPLSPGQDGAALTAYFGR